MSLIATDIADLFIFKPKVFEDSRGYFFESYNAKTFAEAALHYNFIQDNQSKSSYGVIRGLHYQKDPHAQTKLIRVLQGSILDVAVDLRVGSPTFGNHFSIELTDENKKQLLVPRGFAHGFSVLSETAVVMYKVDALYHKESEGGIRYDCDILNIDWKVKSALAIVSEKDAALPNLANCDHNFTI